MMMRMIVFLAVASVAVAEVPANLTVEGVPVSAPALRREAARYMEFRAASFAGWHPVRREMLIATRFGEVSQLHAVAMPGGARRQLTFDAEPVRGGSWQAKSGGCILFSRDAGGGEFYQIHRLDADGRVTLLTDGKSRNTGGRWSRDGSRFAFTSTRRNGKDNDLYVQSPEPGATAKLVREVQGGGWSVLDWSHDDARWLVGEYLSANESRLHVLDVATGRMERLSPESVENATWSGGQFTADGGVITATDRNGEFTALVRVDLQTREVRPLLKDAPAWDVEEFELSPDGLVVAFTLNEEGATTLVFADVRTGERLHEWRELQVVGGLRWHENGRDIGFTVDRAGSPPDAWSATFVRGESPPFRAERWTHSETGGLDPATFPTPEVVRVKSFDGLAMSGFLYRPDAKKFPGPRPCVINIHGGPEGQSQPDFLGRWNFLPSEMGVAVFFPNVRGSSGFGKTFLASDNGFKREDSVRDIGAFIAVLKQDVAIDGARLAVMGGSYGGYMTLASMIHHGAELRCGVDIVGISNFLTFLQNTQDYRRDLRRVEYGDERDPKMAEFLASISPTARAAEIRKPLFIVQGANDPRVPVGEARQMRDAVRKAGGTVWYLEAADEGHGFAKKKNADYLFLAVVQFLREHLLN